MRKKKSRRRGTERSDYRSNWTFDLDDDYASFDFERGGAARFDPDEARFEFDEIEPEPFDIQAWREDMAARSLHRQQLRQRDLRNGVY